jgi:hypothetical protein
MGEQWKAVSNEIKSKLLLGAGIITFVRIAIAVLRSMSRQSKK